jgi:hypothetical protein
MKATVCLSCGQGKVRRVARAGRTERFLAVKDLAVPEDLELPECDGCGEVFLDEKDDAAVIEALEGEYRRLTQDKTRAALEALGGSRIRDRRLEALLNLSPSYLSRIRAGKETSGALATVLLLFAQDPSLVDRAEALWQVGAALRRSPGRRRATARLRR